MVNVRSDPLYDSLRIKDILSIQFFHSFSIVGVLKG